MRFRTFAAYLCGSIVLASVILCAALAVRNGMNPERGSWIPYAASAWLIAVIAAALVNRRKGGQ